MLSMVKLIMHRHVRITAFYSHLQLGSHTIVLSLSHCLLTYPDVVLYIMPPQRTRVDAGAVVSFSSLLTAFHFHGRQDQASR